MRSRKFFAMADNYAKPLLAAVLLIVGTWPGFAEEFNEIVASDIGHTPQRPGAISARGVPEYSFNREMATVLLHEMTRSGFPAAMLINEAGDEIDLAARVRIATENGARILISIHHDSVQPHYLTTWKVDGAAQRKCAEFSGFSVFFSEYNGAADESRRLAQLIGGKLVAAGLTPTLHHAEDIDGERRDLVDPELGVYRFDELAVLRLSAFPAVLLECGIIVNPAEEEKLTDPSYQRKIAGAVVTAVKRFLRKPGLPQNLQ